MARTQTQWPLKLICAAIAAGFAQAAAAMPNAPAVVNGSASFSQTGNALTVTNTDRAIINWNTFSIGSNESVRFVQPSASSTVMNRVLAADPSVLLGSLQSNGKVFLFNPAGITVGAGARIDVAGFVASTMTLSNEDFLANRLNFVATPGAGSVKVENGAEITTASGGQVYLIAPQVENSGLITTPQGEIILAAGQRVELIDTGTPGVKVAVVAGNEQVLNMGQLMAESGRVGMVGAVVRQQGTVSADSVVREGGRIFLKATQSAELAAGSVTSANGTQGGSVQVESDDKTLVSGTASATGSLASGGRVELLGDKVGVFSGAVVDASGETGGGTVLVGGDYQGKNPDIRNATSTTFESNATLKADAKNAGNGGTVVVWSDGTTSAHGNISARGGVNGGNGGFVEVSGKQHLIYRGLTDTSAARGITGSLLLDPTSIGLIAGAGTDSGTTIYGDNIASNLGSSNVILQTSSGGTGNITFTAGTYDFSSATAPNSLTLLAYSDGSTSTGNISLPTGTLLTMKVGAPLKMVAGWDGASVTAPAAVAGFGDISAVAGSAITAQELKAIAGGNITLNGSNSVDLVDLKTTGGLISYDTVNPNTTRISASATGDITITGNAGSTSIALGALTTSGAGAINVTAIKQILDDNGSGIANVSTGSGTIALSSSTGTPNAGELAISADVATSGQITATNAAGAYGSIRIGDVGANAASIVGINASPATSQGSVEYFRYGNLTLGSGTALTITPKTGSATNVGASGNMTVDGTFTFGPGGSPVKLGAGGNLDFASGTVTISGDAQVAAGSNLTVSGGNLSLQGSNNSVSAGGLLDIAAGKTITAGMGTLNVNAGAIAINGTLSGYGDTQVKATGDLTIAGGGNMLSTFGNLTFKANTLNVTQGGVSAARGIDGTTDGKLTLGAAAGGTGTINAANGIAKLSVGGTGIDMYNGSYINSTDATQPAGGLVKLFFPGLSAGGSTINGVASFDGGYKVGGALTTLGSGLEVTYGILTNPVSNAIVAAMNSTSGSGGGTSETSGSLVLAGTSSGTSTTTTVASTQTVGGTEGTFGGMEATTTENSSTTGSTQEPQNAKKKPAQCSA